MSTMKQVVVRQWGGPEVLKVEDAAIPSPQGDQVLVEIKAAGVNFADIMRRRNDYLEKAPLPLVIGAEIAGVVTEAGPLAVKYKKGDRVFGVVGLGGYAQYIAASENALFPLAEPIPFAESTALLIQGLTAHLLLTDASQAAGKTIVVEAAAGGVGSLMVQIAKHLGVANIIGLASSEEKRKLAMELGAHVTIDSRIKNRAHEIKRITNGKGADIYYEMMGGASFLESVKSLSDFGTIINYGNTIGGEMKFEVSHLMSLNQTLRGFYVGGYLSPGQIHKVFLAAQSLGELVAQGKLNISIEKFPLNQAKKAHESVEARISTGKIIIDPWL